MKRFQITIALLAATLTLSTAEMAVAQSASAKSIVTVRQSATKKVRVFSPVKSTMDVSVIDESGTLLFQGYLRPQDVRGTSVKLTNLPDGLYFITANNEDVWMSQGITVRNDQVRIDAQRVTELVRPALVAYAQNKFEVVMPGVKALDVAIYDRANDLVFSQSFNQDKAHRFDLTSLPSGNYTFVYGPKQKQFTERVAIK